MGSLLSLSVLSQTSAFVSAQEAFDQAGYSEALSLFQQASNEFESNQLWGRYAESQLKVAACQLALGQYEAGYNTSVNTLEYVKEELPENLFLLAESYNLIGESQLNLGRNDLALENLLAAENLYPKEPTPELAECYEDLGVTYWNNGNRDLALQYHEKSLDIRKNTFGKRSLPVGDSYNNLGLVLIGEDAFRSTLFLTRALQIYKKELGENHPKVAFCLTNLASAKSDEKKWGEALENLQMVSGIWDQQYLGDHPNKAFTLSNIGLLYQRNGEIEKAESKQQEALQMYKNLFGDKHPDVANSYFLLGNLHYQQNNWKKAMGFYQQSIYANLYDQNSVDIYDLPELSGYYNADILLASLMAKAKTYESWHLDKSLKPKHLIQAIKTYEKCDSLISIIRQLRLNDADKLRLGALAKEVSENAIRISLMLAEQPFHAKKYNEIAFNFCERSKSAVLLEAISETKAKGFAGIPSHLLDLEDSLKNQISYFTQKLAEESGNETEGSLKNQLFEVQSRYRNYISQLEQEYPKYFDLKYQTKMASVEDLTTTIRSDEAILSYFEGEKTIYVFLIYQKGLAVYPIAKGDSYARNASGILNAIKYNVKSIYIKTAKALHSQ